MRACVRACVRVCVFVHIKNNKVPNTDPCGTSLKTDYQFETSLSTTKRCLLSASDSSIQSIMPSTWAF